ncbi:cysteine-rich receptor-like protein kinase 10 [Hordeum vulgare subsp. vulgare]|uniref:non-specific serine/threonine protein kinase n=1 Tax=Hordeum vulgare subsp. vulgare TaxID=112509 RepID=A0A8I6XCB9_HORVV|nr:cysteine-rich receptor-like protein kinase 10 [Hordeum vulgare subsp. vulgare]
MSMATLPILLLLLAPLAAAQTLGQICGNGGNYTSNSAYQANLRLLSSTLPKKAASDTTLFATATAGDAPDTVHTRTLCRGDTSASVCESCVATAFKDAQLFCPYNKDATLYYNACMLRFSSQNFLANADDHLLILKNTQNIMVDEDSFRLFLFTLLNSTAQWTVNSLRRFTTSTLDLDISPSTTLYCLVQCTPDLTANECAACLQPYYQYTIHYVDSKQGGRILGTWCTMRYEIYPFFQGEPTHRITNLASAVPAYNTTLGSTPVTVSSQSQQPAARSPSPEAQTTVQQHQGRSSRKRAMWILAVAAPLFSILFCFICSAVWMRTRRKGKVNLNHQAAPNRREENALVWRLEERSSEFTLFDFSEMLHATHNFSKQNILGQGGFGPVYKGQLPDLTEIAVKRLASHSGQGFTEFKNEVELIAKLQHNNLVKLLGCCIQGEEKVLVYEYLPNMSLDFFIFDENRTTSVDWKKRCVIIEGIAQGLLYLHKHSRLRIIHRDLKASNILLDGDMNPKISDFGLAKIFSSNDSQGSTKRVVGTYGYMSPEYASEGIYSIKSDVFSFGVLLLEILSGKRNSGFHQYGDFLNLLGYSWQLWEGGRWLELLEVSILKEIHTTEARRYINIALMCVQESADDRPTMSDVVAMLNSESVILPEPNHPAYFNLRVSKVHESASVVAPYSNNDVTITEETNGR